MVSEIEQRQVDLTSAATLAARRSDWTLQCVRRSCIQRIEAGPKSRGYMYYTCTFNGLGLSPIGCRRLKKRRSLKRKTAICGRSGF
jgi:hypothetical protein